MNNFVKQAYDHGAQRALQDYGITKTAGFDLSRVGGFFNRAGSKVKNFGKEYILPTPSSKSGVNNALDWMELTGIASLAAAPLVYGAATLGDD